MNRTEKEQAVQELHEKLSKATFVAAIAFDKLDAFTTIDMRKAMREAGVDYKVVKNNLALLAAKGTPVEKLADQFVGPVAVAIGYGETVASAKAITAAFKKAQDKVRVKAAVADGELHSAAAVDALSKLPGLNEMRATLLSLINTPATQIARALQMHVEKQTEGAEVSA